jgi:hypothetical protein
MANYRSKLKKDPEAVTKRRAYDRKYKVTRRLKKSSANATANILEMPIVFVDNEGNLQDFV